MAGAWLLLGVVESMSGNSAAGEVAHLRARAHARAVGDDRREMQIRAELVGVTIESPRPIEELIPFLEAETPGRGKRAFPFSRPPRQRAGPRCTRCWAGSRRGVSCLRSRSRSTRSSARETPSRGCAARARGSNCSQATSRQPSASSVIRSAYGRRWVPRALRRSSACSWRTLRSRGGATQRRSSYWSRRRPRAPSRTSAFSKCGA